MATYPMLHGCLRYLYHYISAGDFRTRLCAATHEAVSHLPPIRKRLSAELM